MDSACSGWPHHLPGIAIPVTAILTGGPVSAPAPHAQRLPACRAAQTFLPKGELFLKHTHTRGAFTRAHAPHATHAFLLFWFWTTNVVCMGRSLRLHSYFILMNDFSTTEQGGHVRRAIHRSSTAILPSFLLPSPTRLPTTVVPHVAVFSTSDCMHYTRLHDILACALGARLSSSFGPSSIPYTYLYHSHTWLYVYLRFSTVPRRCVSTWTLQAEPGPRILHLLRG